MKIIILHDADARIEILNVADNLIKEDIEMFLCEHGYSVNNITWMAANIDNGTVFEKAEETTWKCRNCGHIHVGTDAPVICPVCAHPQAHFEVRAENY